MSHYLWCHGIDGIYREMHPTARIYMSLLELSLNLLPNNWVRTGGAIIIFEKFLSTVASNLSYFKKFGGVYCLLLKIPGIQRPTEGGEALVPQISLRVGVIPSTQVLLTCRGDLFGTVLFEAAPVMISCTSGKWSACGACTTPILISKAGWLFVQIFRSVRDEKIKISLWKILIVPLLNNFWWLIPLLVWWIFLDYLQIWLMYHLWLLRLTHIWCHSF